MIGTFLVIWLCGVFLMWLVWAASFVPTLLAKTRRLTSLKRV